MYSNKFLHRLNYAHYGRYHQERALHVKSTWSRHCDRAVFLSSEDDPALGEVVIASHASQYSQLWDKVTAGELYSEKNLNK